jgi:tetratricopeptide (TPR) repeat protein
MEARKLLPVLLLLLVCVSGTAAGYEPGIGKILDVKGLVELDTLGNGLFLKAETGAAVYEATVIKTSPDGQVTLMLNGQELEIPPMTEETVSRIIASRARCGELPWFQPVADLFSRIIKSIYPEAEGKAFGSKSDPVAVTYGAWLSESDLSACALEAARANIVKGRYADALSYLRIISGTDNPGLLAGERDFLAGTCYFNLYLYPKAIQNLTRSLTAVNAEPDGGRGIPFKGMLYLQLSLAEYLDGDRNKALECVNAFLALGESGDCRGPAVRLKASYFRVPSF